VAVVVDEDIVGVDGGGPVVVVVSIPGGTTISTSSSSSSFPSSPRGPTVSDALAVAAAAGC
jgi:hypothetical protein